MADDPKDLVRPAPGEIARPAASGAVITGDYHDILHNTMVTRQEVSTELAEMNVKVAKQTHAMPALYQMLRTVAVVAGAVGGIAWICHLTTTYVPEGGRAGVFVAGIVALGGAWAIGHVIDKLKQPPSG